MKTYLFILTILLAVGQLFSIGAFSLMNQRNHPELDWMTISTTNCQVIYHEPLEPQAKQTAEIAQSTFDTLVKTYQITPQKTCIIYVSDQDNIPNGAAMMSYYIFIYVNQNDFTPMFTGNDKWIRKVIAHELSHWFLAASIETWLNTLLPNIPPFPRNINEGYAQFFSGEPWGYNRGDRFLKASILSSKVGVPSPQYEGNLMYADGFAKVRYLTAMYGEDSLIKLLKHRNGAKLYSFKEAFSKVYKQSYEDFEEEWKRYTRTYYFGEVYLAKAAIADTTALGNINDFTKLKTDYYQITGLAWKNDTVLFAAKSSANQMHLDLMLATVDLDSLKSDKLILNKPQRIIKAGNFNKLSLSENGQWAAFTMYSRHRHGRIAPRIYAYNILQQKLHRFGEGNFPEVDTTGGIYYQKLGTETNDIRYITAGQKESIIHSLGFDEQIGSIALSPDNQKLAFTVFDKKQQFNISILEIASKRKIDTVPLASMAQSLRWHENGELIFTLENPVDYSLNIILYDLMNRSQQHFTQQAYNSEPIQYQDGKMYVMAEYNQGAKEPGYFTPQLRENPTELFGENYYNKWVNIQPQYQIPESIGNIEFSQSKRYLPYRNLKWRMGFALPLYDYAIGGGLFSEALGQHILGGFAAIPYSNKNKAWWALYYHNATLEPSLDISYSRQQWLSGISEDKLYYQDMDKVTGKISYPISTPQIFSSAELGAFISYTDIKDANDNPGVQDKGFASFGSTTGYQYSLPWRNSDLHKVRAFNADYSLQMAVKKMGMNMDFNQHSFDAGFAYAPLLHLADSEIIRTIAFENRSHYGFVNGTQLQQFLPGIGEDQILQSNFKPIFQKYYLRGYEENHLCRKILNVQNEINIKLVDDLNLNVLADWLSIHHTGLSIWHDYTELKNLMDAPGKTRTFNANGIELRAETNILFLPTVLKFGRAYDMDFEKLSDYFLIEIPFWEMIEKSM